MFSAVVLSEAYSSFIQFCENYKCVTAENTNPEATTMHTNIATSFTDYTAKTEAKTRKTFTAQPELYIAMFREL